MKRQNIYKRILPALTMAVMLLFSACGPETYGPFDSAALDAVITEAEGLIANSTEGETVVGAQQPGSTQKLQDAVDWAIAKKDNAKSQDEINLGVKRLTNSIGVFQASLITASYPWIHQEIGTMIEFQNNTGGAGDVQGITEGDFTIEAWMYTPDMETRDGDYSNTIFSKVMGNGGADDRGYDIRYFKDGNLHLNVGGVDSWGTTEAGAGTIIAGEWMHIAFVGRTSSNFQELYVNGELVVTNDNEYVAADPEFPMVIGNTPPWNGRVCDAIFKDYRFWTVTRTAQEIKDNMTELTGSTDGLAMHFPMNANLGTEFADNTGDYKAVLVGNITWVAEADIPVVDPVVLDFSALDAAVADITAYKATITEGTNDGDTPVGTGDFLQTLLDALADVKANENVDQEGIDNNTASALAYFEAVKVMLIGDADGVYVDRNDGSSIGLQITPNYTPQGDFTVEFEVSLKTLEMNGNGEIFGNGTYGLRIYGYNTDASPEEILASGVLWNFTDTGNGWGGPTSGPLALTPDAWEHIAIVHDDAAKTTEILVNGVQVALQEDIPAPAESGWGETWLGNSWGSKMDGSIKNFRIWNEVRTDLNADIDGSEANLEMYFPLDRVKGVLFEDETGSYNGKMRGIFWNPVE